MAAPEPRNARAASAAALSSPRSRAGRLALIPLWLGFCFWFVLAPRPEANPEEVSDVGQRFIAGVFFALVLVIVGGLAKPWRWPVMLSRVVTAVVLIPMVLVGPAGREGWVYAIDCVFAGVLAIVNFAVIRAGPTPPPRDWPRWATPRRWRRMRDYGKNAPRR